jgi:outer membrane protein OmpA-like peptidoglycan-associated protein
MRRLMMLTVVASMFTGCAGGQEELAAKDAEVQGYKKQLADESGKTAALESKVASLQTQVGALQKQLADANARVQVTGATAAQAQAESAEMKERQAAVLATSVLFAENQVKLTPEAKKSLDTAAEAIMQLKDKAVLVAAYTDDTEGGKGKPGMTKRWQISTNRAMEVANYLVGRGVDAKMVGIVGFGEARPVAPNDSIANRGLNRRAEIAITPADYNLKTIEVKPATLAK